MVPQSNLKQKLLEALQASIPASETVSETGSEVEVEKGYVTTTNPRKAAKLSESSPLEPTLPDRGLENGPAAYPVPTTEAVDPPLTEELQQSTLRLNRALQEAQGETAALEPSKHKKTDFDVTLSMRGVVPDAKTETLHPAGAPSSSSQAKPVKLESVISGGSMADLSGYKDLSKAPMSFGDDDMPMSPLAPDTGFDRGHHHHMPMTPQQHFVQQEVSIHEVDTEFSGNVKTLIRLVNELPEGVTKQTGAQIIRLTMEAMGISMEDVLSEAQSAQSEMLDAVRANIKKIEEYKTVIRKLETDIKYYQGKANELSEIIDLFILSNTSGQKMTMPDDMSH
jgi:hypothetical protein